MCQNMTEIKNGTSFRNYLTIVSQTFDWFQTSPGRTESVTQMAFICLTVSMLDQVLYRQVGILMLCNIVQSKACGFQDHNALLGDSRSGS